MNIKNLKYKVVALTLGIATLFSSGCKDFLDRDIEDGFSAGLVTTKDQYLSLTSALYGGRLWAKYNEKFSWCIHEGLAGNLYNIFESEGDLFFGNVSPTNDKLEDGYTSLFSGVISAANSIINSDKSTLSAEDAAQIEAEARMFRGMAYFLATELWGEVPLIWDNEYDIANNISVPKANRATLYRAIELDWLFAAKHLPSNMNWMPGRVSQWGAKGMLAKLYLTMASCQTAGLACPYECPDVQGYYQKAIDYATDVINNSGASLMNYADIFDLNNMLTRVCAESLFALHYKEKDYGVGSMWQAQLGKNSFWGGPGAGWGGQKSLTWTLYSSYDQNDARKREVCMYASGQEGYIYKNYMGEPEMTVNASGKSVPKTYGESDLTSSSALNNIKKFIFGYQPVIDKQSCPMRIDFLRLADVYLIRAEALMAKENLDAAAVSSAGIPDLTAVLNAHAGSKITIPEEMAFYTDPGTMQLSYNYSGNDKDGNPMDVTVSMDIYKPRTDFIQERRKEFAIEGQAWMDVKRLYYRNPAYAKAFFQQQDRGWTTIQKYGAADLGIDLNTEDGYVRLALYNKLLTDYPEIGEKPSRTEPTINSNLAGGNFNTWFLPLPARVSEKIPAGAGQDFASQLGDEDGNNKTYKW